MKAIRVKETGGPEVMRLEDVDDLSPGPGEVVVRVAAAGVNPVDTYIRSGNYARAVTLPYTPGQDAAGIIAAVGEGVRQWQAGERVFVTGSLSGTYAEQALCQQSHVHPLPETISFQQGAALGVPYGTAWHALMQRANARTGELVLVHGASGGVGSAAVQIARAAGMRVIGTGGSEEGRKLVTDQGAEVALDHKAPDYLDRIPEVTGGHGIDVILEMLANANLGKDLKILAPHGRVVVIGSRGTVQIDPRDAMGRSADILGMLLFNVSEEDKRAMYAGIVAGLENGNLAPIVGREFPLAQAAAAHEAVMAPGAYGKIVVVPD